MFLSGEHHRERVISEAEEARYLAAASPLLHDVSVVLFDTGIRPEECHCLGFTRTKNVISTESNELPLTDSTD